MAATFDSSDISSPLAYEPSQTALLLLDFQNLIVDMLGEDGKAAVAKAKSMRDWALSKNMLIMHSVIDTTTEPRKDARGHQRFSHVIDMASANPIAAQEPAELAADPPNDNEVIVYKQLGHVSGLKSKGAMEVLRRYNIKSLVICGLSTSGAALRTSIGAADDGFVATVMEDACADRVEGLHETIVHHVMPMSVHVAKAEEFVKEYEGRRSR